MSQRKNHELVSTLFGLRRFAFWSHFCKGLGQLKLAQNCFFSMIYDVFQKKSSVEPLRALLKKNENFTQKIEMPQDWFLGGLKPVEHELGNGIFLRYIIEGPGVENKFQLCPLTFKLGI